MNTGSIFRLFILPGLLILFLPVSSFAQSHPADSLVKQTGFISITGTITYTHESPEKKLLDSLQWQQQELIVKKYAGKRIKQILFQRSTGRVMIFFYGHGNVLMDKATAIQEGLLNPDPVRQPLKKESFLPLKPIDIYIDSPLYIGIKNVINIDGPGMADLIIAHPGTEIKNTGEEYEYMITATTPGTATFIFEDSITKKIKYLCHAMIKRTRADDLLTEPEVRLGNIKTLTTDPGFLKQQAEIIVGNGFSLAGGTAYFTGPGFRDVIIVTMDQKLTWMKPYIDLCIPGSQIVFDNVTVMDPAGKVYSVAGFSIKVIDPLSPADASEDYYTLTEFPQFPDDNESLKYYVKQQLNSTGNDVAGENKAGFIFKVQEDGSIAPVSDRELSALTSFERKCFDIIKNGPKWTPGKFKGKNMAMAVTFSAVFD